VKRFDFDRPVERRGSGSFKWDANERMFGRADLLPFWVADMDFATPGPIVDAIRKRLEHPVFGYEERAPKYVDAVAGWLARRHGWEVPREWLMFCPPSSIVAIYGLIQELSKPGEAIAVPTPTYGPLIDLVEQTGRTLIRNPLHEENGCFTLDVAGLGASLTPDTRMILLCSPHNPTGRVFTEEELGELKALAAERDVVVVSDEVHADLVRPGHRHIPYGRLDDGRSVTIFSPNKAFNTAGLPQATAVIPDPGIRERFQRFLDTAQVNHDTTFGGVAMIAAYEECEDWLDAVVEYIDGNHRYLSDFVEAELPGVRVHAAEATYLAWLDYRELGIDEAEMMRRLVEEGGVALYPGTNFGIEGEGFLRMNVACARPMLEEGLERIRTALQHRNQ